MDRRDFLKNSASAALTGAAMTIPGIGAIGAQQPGEEEKTPSDGIAHRLKYNKDGKILYGCPRSFNGSLKIEDGTEVISKGAFIDCPNVTLIDFPSTIKSFSFRETSRLAQLETIIFRGNTPVSTAYNGNEGKFVLQVSNNAVKIIVPNNSKKDYKSAIVTEAGEYAESTDVNSTPFVVKADQMPKESNIIGVKNFSKYN